MELSQANHASGILANLKAPDGNFLQVYLDYARQVCDAPAIFHQFVSYGLIATALGNRVWFDFGDQRIFPHIWFILLAPSSIFHKSSALGVGHRLLNRVDDGLVYPNEFSPEELMHILQEQPSGTFIFYEFMSFATYLERTYMLGTKSTLTEFFDSPPSRTRKIKHETYTVRFPAFCIFSATTTGWFLEKIREQDLFGGWLPRFIYLPGVEKERDDSFPPPADEAKRNLLVKQLHSLLDIRGKVHFTNPALKAHDRFYHKYVAEMKTGDSSLSAFHSRMQMYRLKLAVILEAGSNPIGFAQTLTVSSRSVESAERIVAFLLAKLHKLVDEEFVFSTFEQVRKKVLNIIKQGGPQGVLRKDLLRKSHLSVRFLNDVLQALQQAECVAQVKECVGESHKPSLFYRYQAEQP